MDLAALASRCAPLPPELGLVRSHHIYAHTPLPICTHLPRPLCPDRSAQTALPMTPLPRPLCPHTPAHTASCPHTLPVQPCPQHPCPQHPHTPLPALCPLSARTSPAHTPLRTPIWPYPSAHTPLCIHPLPTPLCMYPSAHTPLRPHLSAHAPLPAPLCPGTHRNMGNILFISIALTSSAHLPTLQHSTRAHAHNIQYCYPLCGPVHVRVLCAVCVCACGAECGVRIECGCVGSSHGMGGAVHMLIMRFWGWRGAHLRRRGRARSPAGEIFWAFLIYSVRERDIRGIFYSEF